MARRSREDPQRADPAVVSQDRLVLELDGPGLEPGTVSPTSFLELAAAFFALVESNARAQDIPLELRGVEILHKCVALASVPNDLRAARRMADLSRKQISGAEEAPHGFRELVERTRRAMRRLDPGGVVRVQVDRWSRSIASSGTEPSEPLDAWLTIRARPFRIGGKLPVVRFESLLEDDFSLRVTPEMERQLLPHMRHELEIEAKVARDPDGTISGGELLSFDPIDEHADPQTQWRAWYQTVTSPEKAGSDG